MSRLHTKQVKLLVFSILLFAFSFMWADTITIGDGTVNSYAPVYPYYGYTYSQSIYLASEVTDYGTIEQITWDFGGTSLANSTEWVIYMGSTDKNEFDSTTDWISINELTEVFNGTVTELSGAGTLVVDIDDFEFSEGNLVIAVEDNQSGFIGNSSNSFNSTTTDGNRTIIYRNDDNNPDPINPPIASYIKSMIPNIVLEATFEVFPFKLSMENVENQSGIIGTTVTYPIQINNDGVSNDTYTLDINSAWDASIYTTDTTTEISTIQIDADNSAIVDVAITVPADADLGDEDTFTFTAISGGNTEMVAVKNVTTTALAPLDDLNETFENGSETAEFWNFVNTTGNSSAYAKVVTSGGNNGANCLKLYNSSATTSTYILAGFTPILTADTYDVAFDAKAGSGQNLILGYATDVNDEMTYTITDTLPVTNSSYEAKIVTINVPDDGRIFFKHGLDATGDSYYIDNVVISETPDYNARMAEIEDQSGKVGTTVTYPVQIKNAGLNDDSYNLFLADNTWETKIYTHGTTDEISSISITHGMLDTFDIVVSIPTDVPNGSNDLFTLTAFSAGNSDISISQSVSTSAVILNSIPFVEDFENVLTENWLVTDDWTTNTNYFVSPTSCAHNNGSDTTTDFLTLGTPIDFTGSTNPYLEFMHIAKTEGTYDKCYVEISTDGITWTSLGADMYEGEASAFNGYFHEDSYSGWGTSNTNPNQSWWKKEKFNLTAYAGEEEVQIRFKVTYDSSYRYGWLIDDITIKEPVPYEAFIPTIAGESSLIETDVTYPVTLKNIGSENDSYTITAVSENNWGYAIYNHGTTEAITAPVVVNSDDEVTFDVVVTIPETATQLQVDELTITATSENDTNVSTSQIVSTTAIVPHAIPYEESFSGNLISWELSANNTPEITTQYFVSEPSALDFDLHSNRTSSAKTIVASGSNVAVKFKYMLDNSYNNELNVKVKTSDGVLHSVWTDDAVSDVWTEALIDLTDKPTDAGTFELIFNAKNTSSYSSYDIWIDDLEVISIPDVDIQVTEFGFKKEKQLYKMDQEVEFEASVILMGATTQNNIDVNFKLGSEILATQTISELEALEDTTFTFKWTPTHATRSTDFTLTAETAVAGDEVVANNSKSKDIRVYDADELAETFDNNNIPIDWSLDAAWNNNYDGWGDDCMKSSSEGMLITPELSIVADDTLSFYAKNSSDGVLVVNYLNNNEWTPIKTIPLSSTFTMIKVGLENLAGTNTKLAFENAGGTVYVDHVVGPHKNVVMEAIAEVTPSSIEFERTLTTDSTSYKTITVKNSGNAKLIITGITLSDEDNFNLGEVTLPDTIGYFEEATYKVRFKPTTADAHSATISFTANETVESVNISGIGQLPDNDNSWTNATLVTLTPTFSVSGELGGADQDWYRFVGTNSNWVFESSDANPSYSFYLYPASDELWSEDHVLETPIAEGNFGTLQAEEGKNYYFKISASSNRARNSRRSRTAFTSYELNFTQRGKLSGIVTNSTTGDTLQNVSIVAGDEEMNTNASGAYEMYLPLGSYNVEASAAGYEGQTENITLVEAGVIQNFALNTIEDDGNDTHLEADLVELPLHNNIQYLQDENDVDWFKFYLTQGQTVRIFAEDVYNTNLDAEAWLYGPHQDEGYSVDESDFIEHNSYGNIDFTLDDVATGYYFLKVAKREDPDSRSINNVNEPALAYSLNIEYFSGSIELTVTDGTNPISDAKVRIGSLIDTTNANGMIEVPTYPTGKYPVYITASGFEAFVGDSLVVASNQLTQYNAEMLPFTGTLFAPRMAMSEQTGSNSAIVSWSFPIKDQAQWINWDNGTATNDIGFDDEQSVDVAVRFTAEDLAGMEDRVINKIAFVPNSANAVYTIKIWKNGSYTDELASGEVVLSQTLPTVDGQQWNEIILSNPVNIEANTEYWIGYNVEAISGNPIAVDAGPMVPNKGALFNSGDGWDFLTELGENYNLSIKAYCEESQPVRNTLSRNSRRERGNHELYHSGKSSLTSNELPRPVVWNTGRVFQGYNVYQNGILVDNMPTMSYAVEIEDIEIGSYDYTITSANDEGETQPILTSLNITDIVYDVNYVENFNVCPPAEWTRMKGLLANPSDLTTTTSGWGADGFGNIGSSGSARINIWGTNSRYWLVSPRIDLGDGTTNYLLEFDLALTKYSSTTPNVLGVDDRLVVLVKSQDDEFWTESNILREWDENSTISNTGDRVVCSLSGFSGNVQFAFYGESTLANEDNDIFIDNVQFSQAQTITGTVTDGSNPLSGIKVSIDETNTMTDENGMFTLGVTDGTYDLVFTDKYFETDTITVVTGSAPVNVTLTEVPNGYLSGNVKDAFDNPVANAIVTDEAGTFSVITDENGNYSYRTLADTLENVYAKYDFYEDSEVIPSIAITGLADITQDFVLNYLYEGNETPEAATLMTVADSVFSINKTGDVDWYKIQLEAGKRYAIYSSNTTLDLEAWAYTEQAEDGTTVVEDEFTAHNNNGGEGNNFRFETNIVETQWAFLKVMVKFNPIISDSTDYTLSVEEIPVGAIHGIVTNGDIANPLPLGNVEIDIADQQVETDSLGNYSIGFILHGEYVLEAEVAEYYDYKDTLTITGGVVMENNISMTTLYEGNETPETAEILNIPFKDTLSVQTDTDADWYKFQISENTIWEFYTSFVLGSSLDPEIYLYGPFADDQFVTDETAYISENDNLSSSNLQSRIEYSFTEEGWYFLRVSHDANDPQSRLATGQYALNIEEVASNLITGNVVLKSNINTPVEGITVTSGGFENVTDSDGAFNIGPFAVGESVTLDFDTEFPYVDTTLTTTVEAENVNNSHQVQIRKLQFGRVNYTVNDVDLNTPIENVKIQFESNTYYTDVNGQVSFDVAPKIYRNIKFTKEYHTDVTIDSVVVAENANLDLTVDIDYIYDDRNEYPETADAIQLPLETTSYDIESQGDIDWYKFSAEAGKEWRIFTESSDVNLKAWVYGPFITDDGIDVDEADYILVGDEDHNVNQPQIVLPVEADGYYFLRVSHYWFGNVNVSRNSRSASRATSGDYTLKIESADPFTPNPIADVILDEDFGTHTLVNDIETVFADFNDNLTYEVMSADTNIVNIEIVDGAVILNSVADMNVADGVEVYIKATDDPIVTRNVRRTSRNRAVGANVTDTVLVTITPVNDSPVVETEIADIDVEEDFAELEIDLTNHFFDVDLDDLSYTAEFDTTLIAVEFTNDMMVITAVENAFGTTNVTITADDQVTERNQVSDTFVIDVSSVNDIPFAMPGSEKFYSAEPDSTGFASITLDASDSYDIDGTITAYQWMHNDTLLANSADYTQLWSEGTDTWVYLTVTDDSMATAMDSAKVFIGTYDNNAPVANADNYSVNEDVTLTITTNGVLANDTDDSYPIPIVAELVTDVEQGVLTLEETGLFTYVPAADFNGNITFEYAAFDGDLKDTTMVTIVVNPINDDPVIIGAGIPDQNAQEDFDTPISLTLADYFNDVDGDTLTYNIDFDENEILVNADDNINLIINPVADWNGNTEIVVTATDAENVTIADTFAVMVTPINDTPVIALPDTMMTNEDVILERDLGYFINDVDLDDLTVEVTAGDHITVSAVTPALGTGLFFSQYMEGSSNNKALEIYNATDQTISLNDYALANAGNGADSLGHYDYWNEFTADAEIAPGDVYVIAHPDAMDEILEQADQTHRYLSNGDDGYALVMGTEDNFVVVDRIGDWQEQPDGGWDVAGVVAGTKDHTLIRKGSILEGNADWTASAGTNADDSEWIVLTKNDYSGLGNHNEYVYTFTPEENWFGHEMIVVSANETHGRALALDSMIVSVMPVNDVPTLQLPAFINAYEDTPYSVDFTNENYLTDIEDDDITLTFSGNTNIEVTINETEVTFDAPENWNGSEMIYFTADDSLAQAIDSTMITFIAVNDAPVVDSTIANIEQVEDFTPQIEIDLDEHFSDVDGDDLTYTVLANDEEITAVVVDNMLQLNPVENWSGTTTINLKAEDIASRGGRNISRNSRNSRTVTRDSVMTSFDVTLTNVNDAPEFTSTAILLATEEVVYTYDVTVADADIVYGDAVTITAPTLPAWLAITDNGDGTATLTGTPLNEHVGDNAVVLSVIDNNGTTPVTHEFTIAVANVNDDPEIDLPATIEFAEDGTSVVDFADYITDIDNSDDELLLTVEGNTNIGVAISGLEVTFTSNTENWIGSETLTFTINDQVVRLRNTRQAQSRAIDSDDVLVTVTPVNDAPFVETEITTINVDEDFDTYSINLNDHFSDPDGDDLTYAVDFDDEEVDITIVDSTLTINSVTDWNGTAQLTITADDNQTDVVRNSRVDRASRDQVQATVDIIVAAVNDAPVLNSFTPEEVNLDADDQHTEFTFTVDVTDVDSDLEYVWTIDNADQNINADEFVHTFTSGGTFVVKVEISDEDNTLEQTWTVTSTITSNDDVNIPEVTQLRQNSPNPFNPTTSVRFDLSKQGKVRIDIYNVRGQLVKTLRNEVMEAGSHSVEWNGKSENGSKSASGVYFIRMQTENYRSMKKALMLK
jgi:hypothetical protein